MADPISQRQARMAIAMSTYSDRPRPLRDVARRVSALTALFGSVVTGLVGWGIWTAVQGSAVEGLLGAISGLVTAATAAWSAFGVARDGAHEVTPVVDPRDVSGQKLVPQAGQG